MDMARCTVWLLQLIATPRAVDDRSVDFEEPLLNLVIRALDEALRHAEGRGQLGLFAEGRGTQLRVRRKRKRDDEEEHERGNTVTRGFSRMSRLRETRLKKPSKIINRFRADCKVELNVRPGDTWHYQDIWHLIPFKTF